MKYLVLFLSLCLCGSTLSDETQKYRLMNDIFGYLGIDQWVDYIKRIKTDDNIPTYYKYPPITEGQKAYFKKFDIIAFERGLKEQIFKNLDQSEMQKVHSILKNPFVAKTASQILMMPYTKEKDGNIQKLLILSADRKITEERLPLIKSIYNLMLYKSISDHIYKQVQEIEQKEAQIQAILSQSTSKPEQGNEGENENDNANEDDEQVEVRPVVNKTTISDVEFVHLVQIDTLLEKVTLNELRQYVRLINDVGVQKFLGLINNYNYFYFYKFDQQLNLKRELEIKKGLIKSK
jgi:hypothetical protein